MSELSSTFSEYERVSGLFRQLNEAALVARQALLGIDPPSSEEQNLVRDQLDEALEALSQSVESQDEMRLGENLSLTDVLKQMPDEDEDISPQDVSAIRGRIRSGLKALTSEDIEIIEKLSAALDSASEILFRRIQK